MEKFEKYNLSQIKTERFYQLPKYLFEDEYFKKMSTDAKVMYAILKDRFELSLQNGWVDDQNNIYFIFSNQHLCDYLGYAEQKIIKLKKELVKFNLLKQERQGLNKPNKLYLLKPKYTHKASNDKELPKSQFQNNDFHSSGTVIFTAQELPKSQSNDTEYSDTKYNDTNNDLNDMNDREEENNKKDIQTNHANHSSHNSITDDEAIKDYYLNSEALELLPKIKSILSSFNGTDIKIILDTLWKALASFEKDCEESNLDKGYFAVEEIEDDIEGVLRRFKGALHVKKENVQSMQRYLMTSLKRALEKQRDILKAEVNYEVMNNWLETYKKEDNQQEFVKNEKKTFATDDKNLNDLIAQFRNS